MKHILITIFTAISLQVFATTYNCGQRPQNQRHIMQVTVDKIDNTNSDGVSRVSCTLWGVPHTSSRIDSVTAVIKGRTYKATDIDGVDFGRYFQWEDEKDFPVEVDIKRHTQFGATDTIKFHTVHGVYTAPLNNSKK